MITYTIEIMIIMREVIMTVGIKNLIENTHMFVVILMVMMMVIMIVNLTIKIENIMMNM